MNIEQSGGKVIITIDVSEQALAEAKPSTSGKNAHGRVNEWLPALRQGFGQLELHRAEPGVRFGLAIADKGEASWRTTSQVTFSAQIGQLIDWRQRREEAPPN